MTNGDPYYQTIGRGHFPFFAHLWNARIGFFSPFFWMVPRSL